MFAGRGLAGGGLLVGQHLDRSYVVYNRCYEVYNRCFVVYNRWYVVYNRCYEEYSNWSCVM